MFKSLGFSTVVAAQGSQESLKNAKTHGKTPYALTTAENPKQRLGSEAVLTVGMASEKSPYFCNTSENVLRVKY